MSTAIEEKPPVIETKADPGEPTTSKPITFNMSEALTKASRARMAGRTPAWKPKPEPTPEEKAALEKAEAEKKGTDNKVSPEKAAADKAAADKAAQEAAEKQKEFKPNREHFKALEEKVSAAEKAAKEREEEAAKLRAELETARKTPPQEVQEKLTAYEQKQAELEKERNELREWRRNHDLVNDDKFKAEYVEPIVREQNRLLGILTAAGTDRAAAIAAINDWNDDSFLELTSNMGELQKERVVKAITEVERLNDLRLEKLKDTKSYAEERQRQSQEEQRLAVLQRERLATETANQLFAQVPHLGEHEPIKTKILTEVTRAARGELPTQELLGKIAFLHALEYAQEIGVKENDDLRKENGELKTKIADLEKFVAANGGASPEGGAAGGGETETYVPITKRIKVV